MPASATRMMTVFQTGSSKVNLKPIAASQTFKKGDILITDANGRLVLGAASGANIAAVNAAGHGKCYIADQDGNSLTQDTLVQVVAANEDSLLRMPLTTNGSAQAFAQSQVGKVYEIRNVSGNFFVDVAANTNAKVEVVERDPNTPASDAWGAVLVRPIASAWGK